ncbi:LysM peptidoglycan-binding domain-containing protein [Bacillus shivajii]|uniref:cell wall hydrolase n=1 Tax=Bacillus shivajii TaxID=1983719 RepID=UPI001CF938D5|nr:LysM peptidoglycan-binding domain-containing protein [Bacillus shivajii]UCZ54891.1 LysM peptidoglycan-binding domain-containing protein [Bacillus shivajii]
MKRLFIAGFLSVALLLSGVTVYANNNAHVVQSGESLWLISQQYGTTVQQLKDANGLSGDVIYPNQRLTISQNGQQHVVSSGETLWRIAGWYGVSVDQIKSQNGLQSNVIYPGQTLQISSSTSSQAVETTSQFSAEERELLARLVHAEAEGEPYKGKVAVAAVVLNRMDHADFPSSVNGVIYETYENGTIFAFEPVQNGHINRAADADAVRAVEEAINGYDPTNGAIYFFNPETATSSWIHTRTITMTIGNHAFAH